VSAQVRWLLLDLKGLMELIFGNFVGLVLGGVAARGN
jgi:hypothetical protein